MREISGIIWHCSRSTHGDVELIDEWHRARGFKQIGYHFVITRDGSIQQGRPVEEMGAHALGSNHGTIGICIVSHPDKAPPTDAQMMTARVFTASLCAIFHVRPDNVIGHYETGVERERNPGQNRCPGFDMEPIRAQLRSGPLGGIA